VTSFRAHQGNHCRGMEHGTVRWRAVGRAATCGGRRTNGGWWCGRRRTGNSRVAPTTHTSDRGTTARRRDRWTPAFLGVCVRRGRHGAPGDVARAGWLGFVLTWPCSTAFFSHFCYRSEPSGNKESYISLIPLQLLQMSYGVLLNQFCKKRMPTCRFSGRWWIVPASVDQTLSPNSTSNWTCHSTWKLCPSTNYTTFTFGEFEVFRWNLENAAKVLELTWMSKGFKGSLTRVLTKLDQSWPRLITRGCWLGFRGDGSGRPLFD
jgi:hypothetical protein